MAAKLPVWSSQLHLKPDGKYVIKNKKHGKKVKPYNTSNSYFSHMCKRECCGRLKYSRFAALAEFLKIEFKEL